jgi:SAM-dependent methyltransferase
MNESRRDEMLRVNEQQRAYYEAQFTASEGGEWEEEVAGRVTAAWSTFRDLRLAQARRSAGVEDALFDVHRQWLGDLSEARVLDLGCFKGNALSLELAQKAREYVGLDLSKSAVAHLNRKLESLPRAHAVADDFLANEFGNGSFDIVYAYSVLHHFRHLALALAELQRIVKPGGIIVSTDPLKTDPLNRLLRSAYRPLQSDRAWEWPFTRDSLSLIEERFEVTDVYGSQGLVKLAYPFLLSERTQRLGKRIAAWGLRFDSERAVKGLPLYLCWHVSFRLTHSC